MRLQPPPPIPWQSAGQQTGDLLFFNEAMGLVIKCEPKALHIFGECSITGVVTCQAQPDKAARFEGQIFGHRLPEDAALEKRNDCLGEDLDSVRVEPEETYSFSAWK